MISPNNDGLSQEIVSGVTHEGHQCKELLLGGIVLLLSSCQDIPGEGDHPLLPILHLKELCPNGEVGSVTI